MKESIWKVALETKKNNKRGQLLIKIKNKNYNKHNNRKFTETQRNITEKKKLFLSDFLNTTNQSQSR